MDQIRDYLDVMFKDLGTDPAILNAKEDMLDNMLSKYQAYREAGKSDAEAIGHVIGEFGSLAELKEALDLEVSGEVVKPSYKLNDVMRYITFKKKYALATALGVMIIIFGVSGATTLENPIGPALMMFCVFIAVVIFINFGLALGDFKMITDKRLQIDETVNNYIQSEQNAFKVTFRLGISAGVGIILLAVIAQILDIQGKESPTLFLILTGIGVFSLVYVGTIWSSFNYFDPNAEENKYADAYNDSMFMYAAVFVPVASLIYVALGLILNWWATAWVIIPVTAIITGAIDDMRRRKYRKNDTHNQ